MAFTILVIDDDEKLNRLLKRFLKDFGYEVFSAVDAGQGLKKIRTVAPDLIILDITMPVMTGIEMLGKLKAENDLKDIPVIMLTAESGKENVMQIVKMGVKDYIVKPFKGEQLIERAKNILKLRPVE